MTTTDGTAKAARKTTVDAAEAAAVVAEKFRAQVHEVMDAEVSAEDKAQYPNCLQAFEDVAYAVAFTAAVEALQKMAVGSKLTEEPIFDEAERLLSYISPAGGD